MMETWLKDIKESFGNSLSVAYQWTLYLNVASDESCSTLLGEWEREMNACIPLDHIAVYIH